jgi:hypothetical protein
MLARDPAKVLDEWVERQRASASSRPDLINEADTRDESRRFLGAFAQALEEGGARDQEAPAMYHSKDHQDHQ